MDADAADADAPVSTGRRAFLGRGVKKAGEALLAPVEARVAHLAETCVRPPCALPELEFLLACTRCSACIQACPATLVFPLPARYGAQAAGTPALDLSAKSCRLCEGWPCVAACDSGALAMPEGAAATMTPRIAIAWVLADRCLPYLGPECGACAGSCIVEGALEWDAGRPRIVAEHCVGCAACREACIADPKAIGIKPLGRR